MKLLVLDGNSILNRAFYGIKLLTTKDGLYTNGIYGFLTMLQRLLAETQPDAVAIAFDRKAPTFRHKAYAGYKAQRKGMPEELAQQLPNLKELLRLLGYRLVECDGFEADDILGTLARVCREEGAECVIATGDRDSLQLVGGGVTVRLASTKQGQPQVTLYDEAKIREEYGVEPIQLIDVKAIQGDTSDNIPGVAGIGPKGAGELIRRFHDLDAIYENLDTLDIKEGQRKKLAESKDNAYLSRWLGTIRTDAPVDVRLSDYIPAPVDPAAGSLMAKLEFFSLMEKMGLQASAAPAAGEAAEDGAAWEWSERAPEQLPQKGETAALSAEWGEDGSIRRLTAASGSLVYPVDGEEAVRALCGAEGVRKLVESAKPFVKALEPRGAALAGPVFDVSLAAYLLNPSAKGYEPERLAQEYGVAMQEWEDPLARQSALLPALCEKLDAEIREKGQEKLLNEIEVPLARVLAHMELEGFAVDSEGIRAYGEQLQGEIDRLQAEVYASVGYEFNINSPKQLGDAFFVKLGLPHGKKTKTGYSTNAEVLEGLRYDHPAVEQVLNYRALAKLKSTYCDGLLKVVGSDGRIHSSFNQTETRTGRISSTEPNLQNIPVRTELGRELRRYFVARPGWVLVDADYSQIELRVLAHVAGDENMIQAFRDNDDIHRRTAAQVFHLPEDMVTPLMRSRAKAVNFGIVYGIGAFSLSKDIGVTRKEAEQYIQDYLHHFSGVDAYMHRTVEEARERGYAETIFGRRRYLPELASKHFATRAFGERVARNMPIQGAAADIIKIAMIRVDERLHRENLRARLILQVHDELIVECPQEEAQKAAQIVSREMENACEMKVRLKSDANIGKTWYDAKG